MFYRLLALLLLSPASVYAQDFGGINLKGLEGFVTQLSNGVVKSIAYMFLTLAVAAFFWGIVEYIWYKRRGDSEKTKIGQNFMLYGLLALFVMFSVWGIIKFAQNIIGIKDTNTIVIPSLEFRSSSSGTDGLTGASGQTGQTGATGNLKFDACIAAGGGVSECRILSGIVTGTGGGSQSGTTNTPTCSSISSASSCAAATGCKVCNNQCVTSGTTCPSAGGSPASSSVCSGKPDGASCITPGIPLQGICISGTCTPNNND